MCKSWFLIFSVYAHSSLPQFFFYFSSILASRDPMLFFSNRIFQFFSIEPHKKEKINIKQNGWIFICLRRMVVVSMSMIWCTKITYYSVGCSQSTFHSPHVLSYMRDTRDNRKFLLKLERTLLIECCRRCRYGQLSLFVVSGEIVRGPIEWRFPRIE